ncbi:ABC transporter substrate-binding protein [Arenibaculum sp.]|jgi:NitT/TauT family transport system substrate-binding protein|uniref:ABC transporter substrate-binding protein n=1 Tax=Arenibaculum sp. TaxID=2865862 RepID=UPI002E14BB93|nr:ABC transporter substrate-binding protein [Arenibaculum sp.]
MRIARTLCVGLALAAAAMPAARAQEAGAPQKVTFNLAWLPQGSLAGVLVAIDRGYYREAGLDVTAVRGYGGNRTVNEIDQGQFEFGYGDPISVALNRVGGGGTRLVGAINTRWPAGLCYVEQRRDPEGLADLAGLTLGGGSGSPVHNLLPAWLEANGQPRDHVALLGMDPAVVDVSLIQGRIDLAECWKASNRAVLQKQAKVDGVDIGWIEYADHGLDMYGSGIVTSDALIEKDPDLVKRFVAATYRGYDFVIEDPETATDILLKQYPVLDRDITAQQVREIAELIQDPAAAGEPLGRFGPERMRSTAAFIDKAFDLGGKVGADDIFTDRFVQ